MMKYFSICVLLLIASIPTVGQAKDSFALNNYGGIYQDDSGSKYIVNPTEGFPHFTLMEDGETHMIRKKEANMFEFSSTRNHWEAIGGTIEFEIEEGRNRICITNRNNIRTCATAIPTNSQELTPEIGGALRV